MATKTQINSFISTLSKIVVAIYKSRDRWVLPSVCIAQAALESGWNLNAKTLFGIKGHGISATTQEYVNGSYVTVQASFKAYPNIAAAVDGYYDLITTSSRYSGAVNNPDYKSAITAIKAGGYATDPDYVTKIIAIIEANGLTKYDARKTVKETATNEATLETIAREVIAGKWGNGIQRKNSLTEAGYSYTEVQKLVNQIMTGRNTSSDIDVIAKEVIAGRWGNGASRKTKLTNAGYDYDTVQKRVNEILKGG